MNINDFLLNNNVTNEIEKEVFVSDRFKDDNENHLPFKIRNITSNEVAEMGRLSSVQSINEDVYVVAKCCVAPNFKSVELQKHYNVNGDVELVRNILLPGEIANLSKEILKISGFGVPFDKLVKDAKKL